MGSETYTVQDAGQGAAEEVPWHEKLFAMFGNELNSAEACSAVYIKPNEMHAFTENHQAELNGSMQQETFEVVKRACVLAGSRVYGSMWVDCLKIAAKVCRKRNLAC